MNYYFIIYIKISTSIFLFPIPLIDFAMTANNINRYSVSVST